MAQILILDDDRHARTLLADLLQYEGHAVIACDNGEQALKAVGRESPDLVITDASMPGMSGIEFLVALRRHRKALRTPIIFHTASGDEREIREVARMYGIAAILTKPCPAGRLFAEIASALGVAQQESFGGISEALQARVPAYLVSCTGGLASMKSALEAGDLGSIWEAAHILKGTGSAYGFWRITQIGDRLEAAAKADDRTKISEQLRDLADYLAALKAASAQAADRTEACGSKLDPDARPEPDR